MTVSSFLMFLSSADYFQEQFFETIFQEYHSLDTDQTRRSSGLNCLQRSSADDTSSRRVYTYAFIQCTIEIKYFLLSIKLISYMYSFLYDRVAFIFF